MVLNLHLVKCSFFFQSIVLPLRLFSWDTNLLRGNFGIKSSKIIHEVNNTGRVSPLVIITGNKLEKCGLSMITEPESNMEER